MRKLVGIVLFLALLSCKQKSETEPGSPAQTRMEADEAPVGGVQERKASLQNAQRDRAGDDGLGPVALTAPLNAQDRLLEYRVAVSYRTGELLAGRDRLFSIASRRGFLRQSHASAESSHMQLEMAVRSTELYDTLKELDALGVLISESIQVTDHTENSYAQSLKAKREEIRTARRGAAVAGDAGVRNWTEREAQLAASEDQADAAALEKWRIQDRVRYATISVNLQGPDLPEPVVVPVYRNAFTGLLNAFLSLVYYLIYWAPVLFVAALLIRYRRQIKNLFSPGKKEQSR